MKLRLILLCLLSSPSFAADYFVSPSGNDSSPGSKAQPWKTISKANQVLQPGDTVYVGPGEYREKIEPARSGQSGKYITYSSYDGRPWITAPPGGVAVKLIDKSYIFILGFGIDGKGAYTKSNIDSFVQIDGGGRHIIEDGDFRNARGWAGISIENSNYNKLLNNRVDQVGAWLSNVSHEGAGDMITMHCASHNLIEGNHLTA